MAVTSPGLVLVIDVDVVVVVGLPDRRYTISI